MEKIYVGSIGTVIRLNCYVDTSTATTTAIKAQKPSGDEVTWEAMPVVIDGETTGIAYTIQEGDLDESGLWKLQAAVAGAGWDIPGETVDMRIFEAYK